MNKLGTKIPIHVKYIFPEGTYGIMKTVSPPRTFSLLLDFVEANIPLHVGVYCLKRFVKIREY